MINIQKIQTISPHIQKTDICFGRKTKSDTFISSQPEKTVEYYDEQIAQLQADIENELIYCAHYEAVITSIKMKKPLLNKLENAPKIDFKEAETIKQAKQFAADNFNIKHFYVEDLSAANQINYHLSHLCNLFCGNIYMPKAVSVEELTDKTAKAIYNDYPNIIKFDSSIFKSDIINGNGEKISLKQVISHEVGHCNNSGNILSKFGNKDNEMYLKEIAKHKNKIQSYEDKITEYSQKRAELIKSQMTFSDKIKQFFGLLPKNKQPTTPKHKNSPPLKFIDEIPWGEKEKKTAALISKYAITDRYEFVAETFAYICENGSIPDEVLPLYIAASGFLPEK